MITKLIRRFWLIVFGIKNNRRYQGFNWAAGSLLRGESILVVKAQATTHYENDDPWRVGALDAINKWESL